MQQNVSSPKEENFKYREKSTKSQSFTPKMFENRGTYCHIYEIYILELFIHKLCIFGIQCHRRCQRLANKEFDRRRTEEMKIPESPLEKNGKKKIDNTLKVMCEKGGIQGRKVNYRAKKDGN